MKYIKEVLPILLPLVVLVQASRHRRRYEVGGHGEEEGVWHGQGVVQVGAPAGVQGGRGAAPGVTYARGAARRLLHVLLELLKVALVLGAPVLEPANDLRGRVSEVRDLMGWRWKETVVQPLSLRPF